MATKATPPQPPAKAIEIINDEGALIGYIAHAPTFQRRYDAWAFRTTGDSRPQWLGERISALAARHAVFDAYEARGQH
jgi:hypothetical protein